MESQTIHVMDKIFRAFRVFKRFLLAHEVLLLVALGVSILCFSLSTERFPTSRTFNVIATQCAEIGLMGLGMGLTIMVGGVDLSVNDTANLSALVAGLFLTRLPSVFVSASVHVFISILLALCIGVLCGYLNGFLVAHLQVPPVLASLGTLTLFRGISAAVTGGTRIAGFPRGISVIGRGSMLGVPIPFLILLVSGLLMHLIVNHSTLGYKIRYVGTNIRAAKLSGIKDKSTIVITYVLSGLLSSIAGIIIMGRTGSVAYEYGTQTYVLVARAITSLAAISPGSGTVASLILSALILQVLSTGFYSIMMTSSRASFFKDIFWGIFMIAILIFEQVIKHARKPHLKKSE